MAIVQESGLSLNIVESLTLCGPIFIGLWPPGRLDMRVLRFEQSRLIFTS